MEAVSIWKSKKCWKILCWEKRFTFCTCGTPKSKKNTPHPHPHTHPTPPPPQKKTIHNYLQNCPKFHDTSLFVDVTNNDTNNQHSQIPVLDLGMN